MKTAVYIQEGITQLVLTPENDWEKSIVGKICPKTYVQDCDPTKTDLAVDAVVKRGSFFQCRGGWTRYYNEPSDDDDSLMFIIKQSSELK